MLLNKAVWKEKQLLNVFSMIQEANTIYAFFAKQAILS